MGCLNLSCQDVQGFKSCSSTSLGRPGNQRQNQCLSLGHPRTLLQDEYHALSYKTMALWKLAEEQFDAEFVIKADDDNYVRLDRMVHALQQWKALGAGEGPPALCSYGVTANGSAAHCHAHARTKPGAPSACRPSDLFIVHLPLLWMHK